MSDSTQPQDTGHHAAHHHHHHHPAPSTATDSVDHHHDVAQANRQHYDENAKHFGNYKFALSRKKRSAEAILKVYPFNKETTTMMEYACGTGLVSEELAPHVKSIVGVDISQGVVDVFNERFANIQDRIKAVRLDLKGEDGELDNAKFDLIICTSAYHHFENVLEVTRMLAYFLRPGGALVIIDNFPTDEDALSPQQRQEQQDHKHVIAHMHGFSEDAVRKIFEGAGLGSITYEKLPTVDEDSVLFIAKGIKSTN
ncbi:S-adenosyl-L-methionine-dependent methyltransferase [Crassisporium funariophilum]|nr:S-adenosyl-L-methionine-dependent methyltransferase [Crassisporium funariophilum]